MVAAVRKTTSGSVVEGWVARARRTGRVDTYEGKRATPRITWDVPVLIKVVSGPELGEILYARARDVSLGGIGVYVPRALAAGTAVEVWADDQADSACGRVAHCTATVSGCIVGVMFGSAGEAELPRASAAHGPAAGRLAPAFPLYKEAGHRTMARCGNTRVQTHTFAGSQPNNSARLAGRSGRCQPIG